jgi:glycopeptide antibiotics resistance protein
LGAADVAYPGAIVVAIVVAWHGAVRRRPMWQVAARVALVLYVGWLLGATLFPIHLEGRSVPEAVLSTLNRPNIVPLRTIRATLALQAWWPRTRLLAGNVVVFMPFGALLPVIWPSLGRLRRVFLAGVLFSGAIELSQLGLSLILGYWYRMSDVDDVILNVAGVLTGYGCLCAYRAMRGARGEPGSVEPEYRRESRGRAETPWEDA